MDGLALACLIASLLDELDLPGDPAANYLAALDVFGARCPHVLIPRLRPFAPDGLAAELLQCQLCGATVKRHLFGFVR